MIGPAFALPLARAWEELRLVGYELPIKMYTTAVERSAVHALTERNWAILARILSRDLAPHEVELFDSVSIAGLAPSEEVEAEATRITLRLM